LRSVCRRAQVVTGFDDASGHRGLAGLPPRARVVDLLDSDFTVDLEHAVVVLNM